MNRKHKDAFDESQKISKKHIIEIPGKGLLQVHSPNGNIPEADLNGEPISNYKAAILMFKEDKTNKNNRGF